MKAAVSCVLIVVLVGLAGATPVAAARQADARSPRESSGGSWSDVQKVPSATEVVVTVHGAADAQRMFLSADASALFVLNLTPLTLSRKTERELRDIVASHAAQLIHGEGGEFVNGDVRIGRAGVFVVDRQIAELSQVIQRIDRPDVVELRAAGAGRRYSMLKATATGAVVGAAAGFAVGGRTFFGAGLLALMGVGVGAGVGASVAAARSARPDQQSQVIYSAP